MIPYNLVDPEKGEKPPRSRVKDAGSARSMLYTLIDDDQIASYRRSQIQGIIDGNSPYNEQQLKEMGQGDRVNVNWGHAYAKVESAVIPYFDMLTSVGNYMTIKTAHGKDMGKREEWSRIISEEAHKTLSASNPGFLANHQISHKQIVIHGQGCLYWPDGTDFRSKAIEPWSLVVPKGAGVDQDQWEFCYILDEMYCEELYRYIENPEIASRGGWNVGECQQAIMDARTDEQDQRRPWEWYQKELKNNGMYYSQAKSKVVKVGHFFVKEYNGRISHYIFDRLNSTEFLCKMPCRYKKFSNAFTVFLNGVGNGYYHGVRGLGQQLYKWAEAINRLNNQALEGAMLSSTVMFQPTTAKDAEQLKTVQIGPYRILPPGLEIKQINTAANLQAAASVLQMFQSQESDDTGSFMPNISGGRKKGNKEIEMEMGEKARLTNVRAEIYLQALDLHYKEVYRRLSNPNIVEEDHGGPEILAFQKACTDRGVPMAAIINVESVRATRSIGQGSSAARLQAMEMIAQYIPQLPEVNRKRVINANIAAIAGQNGVETFGIPEEEKMDGSQMSIASLENNAFQSGGRVLIDPDQNHNIHIITHLQFCSEIIQGLQQQQGNPMQAATIMQAAIPHILTHLKYMEEDPTRKDQFESLNEQTSELMKIADQINSMAQDMMEQQAAQAQQAQQQQPPQDPKMLVAQNKIMLDQAKFQNDAQIKQAKAQHQMMLQDKRTAQRLAIDNLKHSSKYSTIAP